MNKLIRGLKDPLLIPLFFWRKCSSWIKSDELYIRVHYFLCMKKRLHLNPPVTFNEKLQWLKLHDWRKEYTRMVDKAEAKKYVAEIIGEEYIIPTLGVWDCFDEIDFNTLPHQFVLKCTHDSGGLVICKDKSKLDVQKARKVLEKSLKKNYYYETREYPYRDVKPRIIAEKYMVDESGTELKDYKFFCFKGEPKMLFIATDRPYDTRFDFYDTNFNHLPFKQGHPLAAKPISKPKGFEQMLELAAKLSKGIPHVRVDFYDISGQVYFGELTFTHYSGTVPFEPSQWDYKIGEWLELPEI